MNSTRYHLDCLCRFEAFYHKGKRVGNRTFPFSCSTSPLAFKPHLSTSRSLTYQVCNFIRLENSRCSLNSFTHFVLSFFPPEKMSDIPTLITTPLTKLLGIKHPIMLAGMNVAAGPELAAAVTNAGGLGVIGGVGYTPEFLKQQISTLKGFLNDKNAPFGVDLLLPAVGGNARKTNYDYTKGQLPDLIDIIIEQKAKLFVSAVGVPPRWVVEKLHAAGIPVMNMIGAPKHVQKVIA